MSKFKIFVCIESDRKVAYFDIDGKVYRRKIDDLSDILKKLGLRNYEEGIRNGIISEVDNNSVELNNLRKKYVSEQLNNGFIYNLSNPLLEEEGVEMFESVIQNGGVRIRHFKSTKDSEFTFHGLKNKHKTIAEILNIVLKNYDLLKDKLNIEISSDGINKLLAHVDDYKFLEKICSLLVDDDIFLSADEIIKKSGAPELLMFSSSDVYQIQKLINCYADIFQEHIGVFKNQKGSVYEARIYINNHNEQVLAEFFKIYIEECIKHGINYNSKPLFNTENPWNLDTTILYSDLKDLKLRIQIIENILLMHPKWRESFQQPVYGSSRFGTGFYGISHSGEYRTTKLIGTYNDYYDWLTKISYLYMLAKVLIENGIIVSSDKYWKILNSLKNFENLSLSPEHTSPRLITINGQPIKLSEIISKYGNDPFVMRKLRELGDDFFRQCMYKFHALCSHLPLDSHVDISVDKRMLDFYGHEKVSEVSHEEEIPKIDGQSSVERSEVKKTKHNHSVSNKNNFVTELRKTINEIKISLIEARNHGDSKIRSIFHDLYSQISMLSHRDYTEELLSDLENILRLYNEYKEFKKQNNQFRMNSKIVVLQRRVSLFCEKYNKKQQLTRNVPVGYNASKNYKGEIFQLYKRVSDTYRKAVSIIQKEKISIDINVFAKYRAILAQLSNIFMMIPIEQFTIDKYEKLEGILLLIEDKIKNLVIDNIDNVERTAAEVIEQIKK